MSKVAVTKDKLDYLANAISAKSGESLTLTIDDMIEAVDGMETGGGAEAYLGQRKGGAQSLYMDRHAARGMYRPREPWQRRAYSTKPREDV